MYGQFTLSPQLAELVNGRADAKEDLTAEEQIKLDEEMAKIRESLRARQIERDRGKTSTPKKEAGIRIVPDFDDLTQFQEFDTLGRTHE